MIFVVLGMHKSGTTLIAETLHKSGVDMGDIDESAGYDDANHYEREETLKLNIAILRCEGMRSSDITRPCTSLADRPELEARMIEVIREISAAGRDWGFKDPRICLTYTLWRKHLPAHKVVMVCRDPAEVWDHYARLVPSKAWFQRFVVRCQALNAWQVCNRLLLAYLDQSPQAAYVVDYGAFMSDPGAVEKLSRFVGLPLVDCRNRALYRSRDRHAFGFRLVAIALSLLRPPHVNETFAALTKGHQA